MAKGDAGAAAHGGVDFQQRVSAWFLAVALSESDLSQLISITGITLVDAIEFETNTSIDDLGNRWGKQT